MTQPTITVLPDKVSWSMLVLKAVYGVLKKIQKQKADSL